MRRSFLRRSKSAYHNPLISLCGGSCGGVAAAVAAVIGKPLIFLMRRCCGGLRWCVPPYPPYTGGGSIKNPSRNELAKPAPSVGHRHAPNGMKGTDFDGPKA
jgi:hypothetical protein